MENNSPSPVQSMIQSSKSESQLMLDLGSGPVVVGLSFKDLAAKVGMFRALKSVFVRYRYTIRLYIVREIYLWRALNQKLSDIPLHTKESRVLRFVNKHSFVKIWVSKIEKSCLKRITANHYAPSLTVNNNSN